MQKTITLFKPFKPKENTPYSFKEIFKNYELTSINDLNIDYEFIGERTVFVVRDNKCLAPIISTSNPNTKISVKFINHIPHWHLA